MTTLPEISSTERYDVVTANENFQSVSPAAAFGIDWEETVALTLGVFGGIAPDGTEKNPTTVTLTGSQTNYVEMTTAGVVSVNTSAYTAGRVKLFRIVTNANGITSYTDDRSFSPGGLRFAGPSTDTAIARFDGTTGQLQNSVVTISDLGAVAGAISLTIASGTLTDPANALTITQTWNDAADTFVGASIDVTDTNSAAGSLLQRWRLGGTQVAAIHKTGIVVGTTAAQAYASVTPTLQTNGTGQGDSAIGVSRWASGNGGPRLSGAKSAGAAVGTHSAVGTGNDLLVIEALGSDGSAFVSAANMLFEAGATISSGIVSGTWRVLTANSSGTLTEGLRVDDAQKVLTGLTAPITVGQSNRVQIGGTGSVNGGLGLSRFSADAVGTKLEFSKSRNATMGSNTIVQSGDSLGEITWYGADGTNYDAACQIVGESDGTPGSGTDMPGRLRFLTSADGTATLSERMRIDKAGNVVINTAAIATNATDGFLYVPTCAGTPTGTPTTYTGRAPVVVDTTNHKLYFYDGSWRDAGP